MSDQQPHTGRQESSTAAARAAVHVTNPIVCGVTPLPGVGGQAGTPLFEHEAERKLPAKELRLLKQHSCCDQVFPPAQPREGLGSQPSRTVTPQTTHHVLPRDTFLPRRTFFTCRRREAGAGCDGPRLRCARHGIFQGLRQRETLRSLVVPHATLQTSTAAAVSFQPTINTSAGLWGHHQKPAVPPGDFSTRGNKTDCQLSPVISWVTTLQSGSQVLSAFTQSSIFHALTKAHRFLLTGTCVKALGCAGPAPNLTSAPLRDETCSPFSAEGKSSGQDMPLSSRHCKISSDHSRDG